MSMENRISTGPNVGLVVVPLLKSYSLVIETYWPSLLIVLPLVLQANADPSGDTYAGGYQKCQHQHRVLIVVLLPKQLQLINHRF
mmetsp:Transcript_4312/g.5056  ORF Transcript_4312/g.5056 Transcript_4312/m.5056 type:complete len:85 (+) Transcript_4312:19-273(+)